MCRQFLAGSGKKLVGKSDLISLIMLIKEIMQKRK